jgi:hypothetical protein
MEGWISVSISTLPLSMQAAPLATVLPIDFIYGGIGLRRNRRARRIVLQLF